MPQSSQNADEGAFSAPHFGQRLDSGLPHAAQNFLPLVLSVPQLVQRIPLPGNRVNTPSCINASWKKTHRVEFAPIGALQVALGQTGTGQICHER